MKFIRVLAGCALVTVLIVISGCLGMQGQATLDETVDAVKGKTAESQRFVEGYIEYPAPQEKWAGPVHMILHISAKDGGPVQVEVNPTWFKPQAPVEIQRRTLASAPLISGEDARTRLAFLGRAIQEEAPQVFQGCLTPVRARLIRADGTLLEKQGCRSQQGWPRAASEIFNQFVSQMAR